MTGTLFLLQRASAAVLAVAVAVHLATIIYAVRGGLTAGEILARTQENRGYLALYTMFVLAVAIHAPIGLRNVLREWFGLKSPTCDAALLLFSFTLLVLGLRAVAALYFA